MDRSSATEKMLALFPDHQNRWHEYQAYWQGESPGFCIDMSEFGRWTQELIESKTTDRLIMIFDAVEEILAGGDEETATAAATCFLENLLNVTPNDLDPAVYIPLLGPRSVEYCRAWDEFTGVRTPGLWD